MIFVGDIWPGSPHRVVVEWPATIGSAIKCCNLESGIIDADAMPRPFCATEAAIAGLAATYSGAALANNHVGDGFPVEKVRSACERAGMVAFGGGDSAPEALRPATLVDHDGTVVHLLAFGWSVIGCKAGALTRSGVAPFSSRLMLDSVRMLKAGDPASKVVAYVHWGYELDVGPQPAHRDLALQMLAAGADAIIGSHSHNVQAVEVVGKKILAHSLGNWLVPHGAINGNSQLAYPQDCRRQLALEINFTTGETKCHWFNYEPVSGVILFERTSAPAMPPWGAWECIDKSNSAYELWYRANRRVSPALPAFGTRDGRCATRAKAQWIAIRHFVAKTMRGIQGKSYDRRR